jgi:hypothetical protein
LDRDPSNAWQLEKKIIRNNDENDHVSFENQYSLICGVAQRERATSGNEIDTRNIGCSGSSQ